MSPLAGYVPPELSEVVGTQQDFPRIAKDKALTGCIEEAVRRIPTTHNLYLGDAREMPAIEPQSVHLVLTSPPYWTLKEYNRTEGQLGYVEDYEAFLAELEKVWRRCFDALVPGGRLICVVGDVCLSRRQNNGRHTVVPLHASIQEQCREIGFDNLSPIIWHKIANAQFEAEGNGSSFLGKPYEPNGVIKNDIEFILMQRKPGGYRQPDLPTRLLSLISAECHQEWFQQILTGLTGASTKHHPAPYPVELAARLIRMYSFVGDTVLDPFLGTVVEHGEHVVLALDVLLVDPTLDDGVFLGVARGAHEEGVRLDPVPGKPFAGFLLTAAVASADDDQPPRAVLVVVDHAADRLVDLVVPHLLPLEGPAVLHEGKRPVDVADNHRRQPGALRLRLTEVLIEHLQDDVLADGIRTLEVALDALLHGGLEEFHLELGAVPIRHLPVRLLVLRRQVGVVHDDGHAAGQGLLGHRPLHRLDGLLSPAAPLAVVQHGPQRVLVHPYPGVGGLGDELLRECALARGGQALEEEDFRHRGRRRMAW